MRLLRNSVVGVLLVGLILVGVLARVAVFMFGWVQGGGPPAAVGREQMPFSAPGPYAVGLRNIEVASDPPMRGLLWYPAQVPTPQRAFTTYPYGMKLFGGGGSVALATYRGAAARDAASDLTDGPYPMVILSPGFAIGASTYGWLAEHVASYGFVVVGMEHSEELDPSLLWRATVERPRDTGAVRAHIDDELRRGAFRKVVDPTRTAVIGHSYGGYTALAAAGARMDSARLTEICGAAQGSDDPILFLCDALVPHIDDMARATGFDSAPEGLWPAWHETMVDAAIALAGDAVMFGEAGVAEIEAPVMAIGGTADADSPYIWGTELTYEAASSPRKVEIGLVGAEHMVFTGPCETSRRMIDILSEPFCADPRWDKARAHDLVRHFAAAFLLAELKGDSRAAGTLAPGAPLYRGVDYAATGY